MRHPDTILTLTIEFWREGGGFTAWADTGEVHAEGHGATIAEAAAEAVGAFDPDLP